jgi:hypothetical protein
MTLAPTYEAIKHETAETLQQGNHLLSSWVLDISVRMVYHYQSTIMFMRVWRCVYQDCEVIPQALHPCFKHFILLWYL